MSFPRMVIGTLATIIITIALVMIVGCDEKPPAATENSAPAGDVTICATLNGEVKVLSDVNDPTFADGILGQGAAIVPSEGKLYAPFDGKVASVFDTHHAICLEDASGAELLIHIGLDTVSLGGKYYTVKVKDGDTIKAGDLLIEFDLETIGKNFDIITPILVTNADDFAAVEALKTSGAVRVDEPLLKVRRQ